MQRKKGGEEGKGSEGKKEGQEWGTNPGEGEGALRCQNQASDPFNCLAVSVLP